MKKSRNEIDKIKILEGYYDFNVKIEGFDAIKIFDNFLLYFKIKEKHFGISYKNEFINVANKLLNNVKEAQKKYNKS
ncbi:MAG: hypothetical protein ACFFBC_06900 [Promethearchaeota archaeon]